MEIDDIYFKSLTYENITLTWNVVKRTCKNKRAIFRYCINKNINNYILYEHLKNLSYKPFPYRIFLIFEPKPRLVMSQIVADKIVNHYIARYYLLPYLEKKLLNCNVATRCGKGSKMAEKLLVDYVNQIRLKEKNKEIYALKIDISKYFYTISHSILMDKLSKDITDVNVLNILRIIISETDKPYINETIDILNKKNNTNLPRYEKGVGLSIGAMTSQFLAIYYLNDLDHYIKEKLHCKYYVRYMDDFLILGTDKERLKYVWKNITLELEKLKLKVNPKSAITSLNVGISFLGYRYKIEKNRFKILYRRRTVNKIRKRLKVLKKHDLLRYYRSYGSYYGYLNKVERCDRNFIMKIIEKYEYFKEKYHNNVVLIKEGSFYKTFKDDAIVLWYLFKYKWNNNSIAFGISNSRVVLDKIVEKGLGYVIIDNDSSVMEVSGDGEVYELYCKLAIKSYDRFNITNKLHNDLDKILLVNFDNYKEIEKYFSSYM